MKSFLIAFVSVFLVYMGTKILCVYFRPYDYDRAADAMTMRFAKKLRRERGLYLIGIGGGNKDYGQVLFVHFECFEGELDLETCRKLAIDVTEEYLAAINMDQKLRPFLRTYPFTAKNIEFCVNFYHPGKKFVEEGSICFVSQSEGRIKYVTALGDSREYHTIKRESYEEAKKLVELEESEGTIRA